MGIILPELFEAVQAKIGASKEGIREYRRYIRNTTLLEDILFDAMGRPYKITGSNKSAKKFKYYFVRGGVHLSLAQLEQYGLNTIRQSDYGAILTYATAQEISFNEAKPYINRVVCQKEGKHCQTAIWLKLAPFKTYLEKNRVEGSASGGEKRVEINPDGQYIVLNFILIMCPVRACKTVRHKISLLSAS